MSVQFCPFFRIKLEEHTKFHVIQLGRFVIWRMLGASDSLRGASRGQLVSLIQICIVEVAAAGNCFWYYAFVAGEEADSPRMPPISKSIRC